MAIHQHLIKSIYSIYWHSPADVRTARSQEIPVALLEVETTTGTNFSLLMAMEVEPEEQTPDSVNCPFTSVRVRITLGWLVRATLAPATGTPVTVWMSPNSMWPSQTQMLQSSLGWPSEHFSLHVAVVINPLRHTVRKV